MVDEANKDEEQEDKTVIRKESSQVLRNPSRGVGEGRRKAESQWVEEFPPWAAGGDDGSTGFLESDGEFSGRHWDRGLEILAGAPRDW